MNAKNPMPSGKGYRLVSFPKEFERNFWESLDKRYYGILIVTFITLYGLAFYAAFQDWSLNQEQLEAIKRRAIQKVYDVKLIVDEQPKEETAVVTSGGEAREEEPEEVSERGKERVEQSQKERQQRRRGTQADAARRTREMQQKASGTGILAIATGAGGAGSGQVAYQDVLGDLSDGAGGVSDIGKVVEGASGIRPAQSSGERTQRGGKGSGRFDGEGTGIDDMLASGDAGGGTDFERSGDVSIKAENLNITSGSGSRDPESITAAINRQKQAVEYCYQKAARLNPNLRGRIDIEISISPNGRVSRVKVVNSTLGDADLERCITRQVRLWRFDDGASGPVNVRVPFIF
jgi:TonB family protein